jgi:hypothetical protein
MSMIVLLRANMVAARAPHSATSVDRGASGAKGRAPEVATRDGCAHPTTMRRGVPKREMHDVIHSPDDGITQVPLGPLQEASVSFHPDPEIGDAGADLAEEFGENYLRSAISGEDMSELENPSEPDPNEFGGPFVIERPPSSRRRRHKRR